MTRRLDRRIPFFAAMAAVCFALVPLAEAGLRYVPAALGCTYVVLALLFLAEHVAGSRR
ncbi:MAG: hypothetical protein R2755_06160 [Acidimicrobiales bacterium]